MFRPLRHNGLYASHGNLQRWIGNENGLTGLMHCDYWFGKGARTLELKDLTTMTSFVFCFANGEAGGFTRIYNYAPTFKEYHESQTLYHDQKKLQRLKIKPSYYVNAQNAEKVEIVLKPGDLLSFNIKNFHEVGAVAKGFPRVTGYIFSGPLKNGEILYWF
ncbi:MAG: hypothetical protein M3Q44_02700 [bacterium]|nr:hypothetical protein [bacterium]